MALLQVRPKSETKTIDGEDYVGFYAMGRDKTFFKGYITFDTKRKIKRNWFNVYINRMRQNPVPFRSEKLAYAWIDEKFKHQQNKNICQIRPVDVAIIMMKKRKNERRRDKNEP